MQILTYVCVKCSMDYRILKANNETTRSNEVKNTIGCADVAEPFSVKTIDNII